MNSNSDDFSDLGAVDVTDDFSDLGAVDEVSAIQNNKPKEKTSMLEAAADGLSEGALFNFNDEATGLLYKGMDKLQQIGILPLPENVTESSDELNERLKKEGFKGEALDQTTYEAIRDSARERSDLLQDQHPAAHIAGNIAGGLTTMGGIGSLGKAGSIASKVLMSPVGQASKNANIVTKVATGAANMIPTAALTGVGNSNSDGALGIIDDAAKTTGIATAIGGSIPLVGSAVRGSAGYVSDKLTPIIEKKLPSIKAAYDYGKEGVSTFSNKFVNETNSMLNNDLIKPIKQAFTANSEEKALKAAQEQAITLNTKAQDLYTKKVKLSAEIDDTSSKLEQARDAQKQYIDVYNFEKQSGNKKALTELQDKIKQTENEYKLAEKAHVSKMKEADELAKSENDLILKQQEIALSEKNVAIKKEQAAVKAQKEVELTLAKQKANETLLNKAQGDKVKIKDTYNQIDNTLESNGVNIDMKDLDLPAFAKDIKKIRPGEDTDALINTFDELFKDGKMDIKQKRLFIDQLRDFKSKNPEYTNAVNGLIKRSNDTLESSVAKAGLNDELALLKDTNRKYYKLMKLEDDVVGKLDYDKDLGRVVNSNKLSQTVNNLDKQAGDAEVFGKVRDAKDVANFYSNEFGKEFSNIEQDLIAKRQEINNLPISIAEKNAAALADLENAIVQTKNKSQSIASDKTLPPEVAQSYEANITKLQDEYKNLKNQIDFVDANPINKVVPQTPQDTQIQELEQMLSTLNKSKVAMPEVVTPEQILSNQSVPKNYIESIENNPEQISRQVKTNIGNLNDDISNNKQDNINQILKQYQNLTGKNLNPVAEEVSKRVGVLGQNDNEVRSLSLKNISAYGPGAGNLIGIGVNKITKIKDVTVENLPLIIKSLQSNQSPAAIEYSKQLSEATSKDKQNAKLFDLKQQPSFRNLFNNEKKEK